MKITDFIALNDCQCQAVQSDSTQFEATVSGDQLRGVCQSLAGQSQLLAMFANDERGTTQCYQLYLVFALEEGVRLTLITPVASDSCTFPSVTPILPAAQWYEREIKDLFGLQPLGHPDPRRLVLHRGWPKGLHPLRKDYDPHDLDSKSVLEEGFTYQKVTGDGVIQVPVGPIHAGIIEPGHFRFHVVGESVLELDARFFYTHRGLEKLAEGKAWPEVQRITERICGVCTVSHSFSFALAIEQIAGKQAPERANYLRVIYGELERVYNHLNDISAICAGVGLALGSQKAAEMKERALRLNNILVGHRYLQGVIIPGGVKQDFDSTRIVTLKAFIEQIEPEVTELWQALKDSDSLFDRLGGTGILTKEDATLLGVVGPAARASGLALDTRVNYPYAAYQKLTLEVPIRTAGDVYSRLWVRVKELGQSFRLLRDALADLPSGSVLIDLPAFLPPWRHGFGVTESPRGSDFHWLMTGAEGTIYRYFIRSASYPNWPAVVKAVPGNIMPDFPLINKSFELCYSCLDR